MWLVLRLLALGVLPAVWLSGYVLLARLSRGRRLPLARGVMYCLAPALGFPIWSLAMSITAYFGVFSAPMWGAVGWIVCIPLLTLARQLARQLPIGGGAVGQRMALRWRVGLCALLASSFALYAAFPHDSFFVGRDQGTYANQALHIVRTGDLFLREPITIDDPAVREASNLGYLATGVYPAPGRMKVQFSPVLPIWLAVMFSSLGIIGFQGLNALVSALSSAVFFGLVSRVASRRSALVAAALLAFNPMQIWISRVTLSEISTQYLVLSGGLLLLLAPRRAPVPLWVMGGITLGASVLVRIDGFVLAPLAVAFGWLSSCLGGAEREPVVRARRFGVFALLGMLAVGVPLYWLSSTPYLAAQAKNLVPIGVSAVALLPVWWLKVGRRPLVYVTGKRPFWVGLAVGLALLGLFAQFIRPRWEPFSLYTNPGGAVVRDFRENSFVNLGVYVTPVMALSALAGYWLLLRRALGPRLHAALLLLSLVSGGYALLYLYAPSISPDHPWGMRRFVPVVFPSVVLSFVFFLDRARYIASIRRFHPALSALVCAALLGAANYRSRAGLFLREYAGAYELVTALADAVPQNALLLCDITSRVFGHMVLGRGLQVMRVNFADPRRFDAAQELLASRTDEDEPYYVMTDDSRVLSGEDPIRTFSATFQWLGETTEPPASKVRSGPFNFYLYERRGPLAEPWKGLADLGVAPVEGVRESGFWPTEGVGNGRARWTKAEASLDIPLAGWSPRTAFMQIIGIGPNGTWLTVRANDTEVYNAPVRSVPLMLTLRLPRKLRGRLELEIISDTFRPSEVDGSPDQRELGVRLASLVLR